MITASPDEVRATPAEHGLAPGLTPGSGVSTTRQRDIGQVVGAVAPCSSSTAPLPGA